MVNGKTKSGIKYTIDERVVNDTRFFRCLVDMESDDVLVQSKALFKMIDFLFGSEKNALEFQNLVAAKHNGICDANSLSEEVSQILEAITSSKNS